MIIEIHALQNLAPSNINRDESGAPKTSWFGGEMRQRVSSQSWKRAIRDEFSRTLDPSLRATRTRRIVEALATRLPQHSLEDVTKAATTVFSDLVKLDNGQTPYLFFLAEHELAAIALLCDQLLTGGERRSTIMQLLMHGSAADLALFGRMLADQPSAYVEAACHVAHALSVNRVPASDVDFFTAADDLQSGQGGAAMMGQIEFVSSCLYRYVSVDGKQLLDNLGGDQALADQTLRAFLDAFALSMPSGKQHSFATFTPPSLLLGVVRDAQRCQLVNAFAKPCRATSKNDLIGVAELALDAYWKQITTIYGTDDIRHVTLLQVDDVLLPNLSGYRVETFPVWTEQCATAMQGGK